MRFARKASSLCNNSERSKANCSPFLTDFLQFLPDSNWPYLLQLWVTFTNQFDEISPGFFPDHNSKYQSSFALELFSKVPKIPTLTGIIKHATTQRASEHSIALSSIGASHAILGFSYARAISLLDERLLSEALFIPKGSFDKKKFVT